VKPAFVFKGNLFFTSLVKKIQQVSLITSKQSYHEFNLSLLDLHKSVYLTLKYTKLREQFKTI